jgi:chromosome segregation ATPase
VVKTVYVNTPATKLSKGQLAGLLLKEIPAWQRAVLTVAPMAALVGLLAATKKWVSIETTRIAQLEGHTEEKSELGEQLATLELELAALTKVSAGFEEQLSIANASLVISKEEVEAAGKALEAAKADSTTAGSEVQKRADKAQAELEAQLAATADLRIQLALAQTEASEAYASRDAAEARVETAQAAEKVAIEVGCCCEQVECS